MGRDNGLMIESFDNANVTQKKIQHQPHGFVQRLRRHSKTQRLLTGHTMLGGIRLQVTM